MKKITSILCAGAMMALCLTGCGGSASSGSAAASSSTAAETSSSQAASVSTAAVSGTVATGGSTSMESVITALQEAFLELQPDVTVTYDPTGSGAGITGATDKTLDIGLSSRAVKDEEAEAGVTGTTVALDGIAIIVNNNNAVADLSLEQIAGIAKGEITNWSEVGGADAPIVLVGREAGSGTRDGFESIVGVADKCQYAQELTSTGAVITGVAANNGAIGYASLSALKDTVKAVTVEGVACTEETVLDGTYKIQRPFNFVTNDSVTPSDAVQSFIDFATSAEAADLIRAAGAVPMA